MSKLWDPVDIAWLAGVLEGEGCFSYKSSGSVVVVMTDQDVIERLRETTGIGTINGPVAPQKSHHKPSWRWQVSQKQDVVRLLLAVYPLMGERRKATIAKLTDRLARTKTTQRNHADHCIRGHAYTHANTYVGEHGRQCRQCMKFNAAVRLERVSTECVVDGCTKGSYSRGMCKADYQRWWYAQKSRKPAEAPAAGV